MNDEQLEVIERVSREYHDALNEVNVLDPGKLVANKASKHKWLTSNMDLFQRNIRDDLDEYIDDVKCSRDDDDDDDDDDDGFFPF